MQNGMNKPLTADKNRMEPEMVRKPAVTIIDLLNIGFTTY